MSIRSDELAAMPLIVPVRSSGGAAVDPSSASTDAFRHGTDDAGERFLAAFTSPETFAEFGPPGSDHVTLIGRELFARAEQAGVRVVVDPGAPSEIDVSVGLLRYLAVGLDPNVPDALRARRPLGEAPDLQAPDEVPEPLGERLRATLESLPRVERAWLLRSGDGWALGVRLDPEAVLADFDEVRNRLHAVATETLGSRRLLAVTDVRAPALRDEYDALAAPFHVRRDRPRSLFSRIFGG